MLTNRRLSPGLVLMLATAASALVAGQGKAEPSIHYADAPAVLPAPIIYENNQYPSGTTVRYRESSSYVTYRRAYTQPAYATQRVVHTAPAVSFGEPVVYTRTYRAPRRVLHINTGPYYHPDRAYGHYGYGHRYYRPSRHHYPRYRYERGHHGYPYRGHHYRSHHYRPRGWGFSAAYGRGHHGHGGGAFSFYLNR